MPVSTWFWEVWLSMLLPSSSFLSVQRHFSTSGVQVETAKDAALSLDPLAGKYCSYLFAFGLVNASLFSASILPLSTTYLICEGLGWEAGIDKKFVEAPQFYGIYSLLIFLGAGIILYPEFPLIPIMYLSQVLNGMVLPFVLIFMLVLINDKKIMGKYTNGPILNSITWVTCVVMIGLTLLLLIRAFETWYCSIADPGDGQEPLDNYFSLLIQSRSSKQKTKEPVRKKNMGVRIKWRAIRPHPVFLRILPVTPPKTVSLFRIADIHDFHHRISSCVDGLSKNQTCHNRQNYLMVILFFCLISVERRVNAPLNGELLRQRLVGGANRAAQQSAGASRSSPDGSALRQPARSAQLAAD